MMMGAAASGAPPATYSDAVLAASPVLYWRLDETSGATANDASGNGRHGTYSGTYTQGVSPLVVGGNSAVRFSAGFVDIAQGSWFPSGAAARAIEFWAEAQTVSDDQRVFGTGSPENDGEALDLVFEYEGGELGIRWRHNGGNLWYGPIADDAPAHCVFVVPSGAVDTDDPYMILNGVERTGTRTGGSALSLATAETRIFVGCSNQQLNDDLRPHDGPIDEVALYDYAPTTAVAQQHYNLGIGA
ncbi:LamG-like jellyroll fold domain-containing protein [Algiphilus aromaticivorans]|uniref:LamG-like jellyroll fold domain-containing protein n=1 Tax=Algiphilus aromaticivorans TaxID=382454 RepID=UPI0012EC4252|nr:LamG-like jellyroll fold domain-containing protein [Algiphilus aromaticivorans]